MSSFFYSAKTAKKEHYPIPEALNTQHVLGVLHDHSVLVQVLWPRQVLEEKRTDSSSTTFTIGPSDSTTKATLTSQGNGIVCTENMPLGLQFTVTYRIVTSQENSRKENTGKTEPVEAESTFSLLNSTTSPTEPRLHLEEERSVLAPKPLSKVLNMSEGPIVKTQNLVMVLEEVARNGMDIASALGSLKASTTNGTGKVEKRKEE
ncbi:hypothetical protein SI65_03578 [Aspergillus cristatus]|uniref:Uncharacterized protein n=1 Tax=Aspergillus cristatus TaxID=573508 RepID=A0A1E3BHT9_ASPCR|nr:hypothetical protein SI65_03578 [Aspergillus cristatus]